MPASKILPQRETHQLLKGRNSQPGSRYFVTVCTDQRKIHFRENEIIERIIDLLRVQHLNHDNYLYCAVIMPDHIHLLFQLGDNLSLERCVSKFKQAVRMKVFQGENIWQRNFFDYRLRPDDELEFFALYLFMNPYRKGLIKLEESWGGWVLNKEYKPAFVSKLYKGKYPQEQWLKVENPIKVPNG